MLKKFERCRLFSFLCFFPVFASHTRAQQTPGGITGIVMDVSGDAVSLAGPSMGLGLGG